jgi:hypothetical protein
MELIGIFFVASGLLVLAGLAKAAHPDDTARALVLLLPDRIRRGPHLPLVRHAVRVGALLEVAIGAGALLVPRTVTAALVAGSYSVFVCTVGYAKRTGNALSTCGCFGRPDTPATGLHVLLNVVFLAAAVVVALHPPSVTSLVPLLERQPWHGVPLLFASGAGVWLTYLALSHLAALEGARQLVGRPQRKASTT